MGLNEEQYRQRLEGYKTSTLKLIAEVRESEPENSIRIGEIISDPSYEEEVVISILEGMLNENHN